MATVFADLPTTIFEVMSGLARTHQAINLGQGFPDDPGPADVRAKAADAVANGYNQYPSMWGLPELRHAIAAHDKRFYGLDFDPEREIVVTSGATEALAAAILGLVEPGDEVVLFQPLYDAYVPLVRRAGGVPKLVTLRPPAFRYTEADLAAAFSPRTRLVVINTPLNPLGKVFDAEELALLARFVLATDARVISDEVWEHVVFDGRVHLPLPAVPGLRERAVRIGSAGKIFALTGWKVGFVCGAADIIRQVAKAHQFLAFTTAPNLQVAVAYGLGKDDAYYRDMATELARKRDLFEAGLAALGLPVLKSRSTYFTNVDLAGAGINEPDHAVAKRLVTEAGVASIPVSAFYVEDAPTGFLRFCFAKADPTLTTALDRLQRFRQKAV